MAVPSMGPCHLSEELAVEFAMLYRTKQTNPSWASLKSIKAQNLATCLSTLNTCPSGQRQLSGPHLRMYVGDILV